MVWIAPWCCVLADSINFCTSLIKFCLTKSWTKHICFHIYSSMRLHNIWASKIFFLNRSKSSNAFIMFSLNKSYVLPLKRVLNTIGDRQKHIASLPTSIIAVFIHNKTEQWAGIYCSWGKFASPPSPFARSPWHDSPLTGAQCLW